MLKYGLMMVLIVPTLYSMDEKHEQQKKSTETEECARYTARELKRNETREAEYKLFVEELRHPREDVTDFMMNQLDIHPEYLMGEVERGLTPLWFIFDVVTQNIVQEISSRHQGVTAITEWYSKRHDEQKPALPRYSLKDLFINLERYTRLFRYFLERGATIDFSSPPAALNYENNEDTQAVYAFAQQAVYLELKALRFQYACSRARAALVAHDVEVLNGLIDEHPGLLTACCSDTKATLLHEAARMLDSTVPQTLGTFRLLLQRGADYTIEDDEGFTVESIMSLRDEHGNYLNPGAELFHFERALPTHADDRVNTLFPSPEKVRGLFFRAYAHAEPYRQYIFGVAGLTMLGYLFFGKSSSEPPPLVNAGVLE